MHILIIHQAFAALNEPGGTRHYELAHYLAERGHKVTIIASSVSYISGEISPPIQNPEKNITILRAYVYQAHHKSFVHRVFAFLSFMVDSFFMGLKLKNIDLIWGTSPPIFQGMTAWALARLKRVPFLFEVRDLWPAFAISAGVLKNGILIRASEWLEKFLYRGADRVMVNSPGYIDHVKNKGAEQIELLTNGVDVGMFDPAQRGESFRASHHLQDKFTFLYAGAHGMSNDLESLLDSAKLLEDSPNIHILLLGDGKEKANLQAKAQKMGLKNLSFLPSVPKNEMAEAIAGADACLAILKPLELYKTTYPNKVFDYMAAGRPVILAIGGVIREVVEAARGGIPVPPGDAGALAEAIRSLAEDRRGSKILGQNGRRYVETHFERAIVAEKLNEIIEAMG